MVVLLPYPNKSLLNICIYTFQESDHLGVNHASLNVFNASDKITQDTNKNHHSNNTGKELYFHRNVVLGQQEWFNICKRINMIHPISKNE